MRAGLPEKRFILALDTAMSGCSAAAMERGGGRCARETQAMTRGQSEALMPMVERVMAAADASYDEIAALAVTVGPGAFTGLRLALAAARTLALVVDAPVIGLTTLEILARQFIETENPPGNSRILVVVETKRRDYYAQLYNGAGVPLSEPLAAAGEDIRGLAGEQPVFVVGDAARRFAGERGDDQHLIVKEGYDLPDPCLMARMAAERLEQAPPGHVWPVAEPVYLRGADVTMPKKRSR